MSEMDERLEWAILAPVPASRLKKAADKFRPSSKGLGAMFQPEWEIVDCERGYSALFDRTPGSRDSWEVSIATSLSAQLKRPVYVVYPNDPEEAGINVYEGGKLTSELSDDPYDFARELGCPLPGAPEKTEQSSTGSSVAVVEGASAADAQRALGYDDPRIFDGPAGAIVTREDSGDLAFAAHRLSEGLPNRDVYIISTGPTPNRFVVLVVRDGKTTGSFEYNFVPTGHDPLALTSIKGKRTPREIADALGIPKEMLDLKRF